MNMGVDKAEQERGKLAKQEVHNRSMWPLDTLEATALVKKSVLSYPVWKYVMTH